MRQTWPSPHVYRAVVVLQMIWLALLTQLAHADEIRVFAAGAAKQAVESLAPAFEKATGHTLRNQFDTVGALRDRVLQAPPASAADVVMLSDAALNTLRAAGRLVDMPVVKMGQVVVALAVPQNAIVPDLSNGDALRSALIAASSLAYADPARGATAGTHFAKVVADLGLRDTVRDKTTVMPFGVDVIRAVSEGRFALGVSQSSEIMQHPGIRYAGPLPAPYGLATGYGAALASDTPAARQLLNFLAQPAATQAFRHSGFVPEP